MAQDIILKGIVLEDVPALKVPKDGGGYAMFTDVTDTTAAAADVASGKYFYTDAGVKTAGTASGGGGSSPVWVASLHNKNYKFSETGWANWTPSTTTTTIIAAADSDDSYLADMSTYEYIIRTVIDVTCVYNAGSSGKSEVLRFIASRRHSIFMVQNSASDFVSGTDGKAIYNTIAEPYRLFYKDSGGNIAVGETQAGIYWNTSSRSPTITNATTTTPTISMKIPSVLVKCSNVYFTTANAGYIDANNSRIKIKADIYRVQKGTLNGKACYQDISTIYNTPL